jgi:acyl dehydratase
MGRSEPIDPAGMKRGLALSYERQAMSILDAAIGSELPPLVKPPVTREQLRRYAEASGDFNPIHLDDEAARRVGLDGVIAHGMLSMAFLGQFIEQQIASYPDALLAQLKVRFSSMVRPGDVLTCRGTVMDRNRQTDGRESVTIECWAENQRGEKVTSGEAVVFLPPA